jgi:Chaperone of endosialidase
MPSDDLVLNVRQIAGYTPTGNAPNTAALLMQLAGLGSAYASISPQALVATALASPGSGMAIGGQLSVQSVQGGSAQFSNALVDLFSAQRASIGNLAASLLTIGGIPVATVDFVAASTVASFNGRNGAVCLWINDILDAGGAPLFSPVFGGCPRAPTPDQSSNSSRLATTAFVQRNAVLYIDQLLACQPFVFTFNGRSGAVVLTEEDILAAGGGTVFDSVALTGVPTAPTAPVGTNTTQLATTAFVITQINASTQFAPIDSPDFTGFPSGPTAPVGTSTGQFATTAFVMDAVAESTAGVASFNGRSGNVTLGIPDIVAAGGATLTSPAFTGTPTGPTAAPGTSNTQLATTAFAANLAAVSSFNTRTGAIVLTQADIIAAAGAPINGPLFTGVPEAATAAPGTSTTQLATTAYVMAALSAGGGVLSFNGRAGAVTLTLADVTAAGGAVLASPAFTGVPTAPTAPVGTNTTQLATTAYVAGYLPLAGGTMTGPLVITPSAAPACVVRATAAAANPAFTLQQLNATNICQLFWNASLNTGNFTFGASSWFIDSAGNFNVSGATAYKPGGGSWSAPASDARVKNVVEDYAPGLDEVLTLHPVVYTFKGNDAPTADGLRHWPDDPVNAPRRTATPFPGSPHYQVAKEGTTFVGLIAQELEVACPDMVTRTAGFIDGQPVADLRQVNISNLVYMLVNAVKTLAARVSALEAT